MGLLGFRIWVTLLSYCIFAQMMKGQCSQHQLNKYSRCLSYPHQLSDDTIHCFTCYTDTDQHLFSRGLAFHCTCISLTGLFALVSDYCPTSHYALFTLVRDYLSVVQFMSNYTFLLHLRSTFA